MIKNKKKRILITGGAGCLGFNLYNYFKNDYEITILDCLTTNVVGKGQFKFANFYSIDISNLKELTKIFEKYKPNIIIHSAASYSDPNFWIRDIRSNTIGTINLIKLCEKFGIDKFIYFQTTNCYGNTDKKKIDEKLPLNPNSSYGISKASAEEYLQLSSLPFISLRLCIIYGPWHFNGPIPIFYNNIKNKIHSEIVSTTRQFLFIKDFLNLVNKILNTDTHESKIFNVGSNETITIEKIFFKIQKIMNCNDNLFSVKQPSSIDLKAIPLDDSLIRKELKWKPEYNIDLGLKLIIQWYEKNKMRKSYSHLK